MYDEIKKLPKILLHCHLDGSVSKELLKKYSGLNDNQIFENSVCESKANSYSDFSVKFDFPLSFMQTTDHLEEISKTLVDDLEKDNVKYAEIRFAPIMCMSEGLDFNEIIEAVLKGLKSNPNVKTNLILCMVRGASRYMNIETLRYAWHYLGKGVCGVDLEGDEGNYPLEDYEYLIDMAKLYRVPYTIHAGEVTIADIRCAVNILHSKRLGHGIQCYKDGNVLEMIKKNNVLLEVCPTSNYQTNAIDFYVNNPIYPLYRNSFEVCVNTDNNTVSDITLSDEYFRLYRTFGFTLEDFRNMNINAIEGAFLKKEEKEELKKIFA